MHDATGDSFDSRDDTRHRRERRASISSAMEMSPGNAAAATSSCHSASHPNRSTRRGDLYAVDVATGKRYHMMVRLQGLDHQQTTVTHGAMYRAILRLLSASCDADGQEENDSQLHHRPAPLLLINGAPLDRSETKTLPNGASLEIHCAPDDQRRCSSTSSLPESTVSPSQREVSLGNTSPLNFSGGIFQRAQTAAVMEALTRSTVGATSIQTGSTEKVAGSAKIAIAVSTSSPSGRLPARHAQRSNIDVRLLVENQTRPALMAIPTHGSLEPSKRLHTPTKFRRDSVAQIQVAPQSASTSTCSSSKTSSGDLRDTGSTASTFDDDDDKGDRRDLMPSSAESMMSSSSASELQRLSSGDFHRSSAIGWCSAAPRGADVCGGKGGAAGHEPSDMRWAASHVAPSATEAPLLSFSPPKRSTDNHRPCSPLTEVAATAQSSGASSLRFANCVSASPPKVLATTVTLAEAPSFPSPTRGTTAPPPSDTSGCLQRAQLAEYPLFQPPESITTQVIVDAQRDSIAPGAIAEQQRLLTRLRQCCQALGLEKQRLAAANRTTMIARESAARLVALRSVQEDIATNEVDAVRARLGESRNVLLGHWMRELNEHRSHHPPVENTLLQRLEKEGETLTISCLSNIAGYHAQRAHLQTVQLQCILKVAELARLRREAYVRRSSAEEERGCLRVVARLRPPSRPAWLTAQQMEPKEAREANDGYAVRVVETPLAASGSQKLYFSTPARVMEVEDAVRHERRRYRLWAAYDASLAGNMTSSPTPPQQRLFEEQLQPLLEHMCLTGQHVAVMALGAVGSGKTYALVGPRARPQSPLSRPMAAATERTAANRDAADSESPNSSILKSVRSNSDDGWDKRPLEGVTLVSASGSPGITPCLTAADAVMQAGVLQSLKEVEATEGRARSAQRDSHEQREWRERAGVEDEDGLLPRAVAWLTAHLRSGSNNPPRGPVVESIRFSMYEVESDHVRDLLPPSFPPISLSPPPSTTSPLQPQWNAGRLPTPHSRNCPSEQLPELKLELVVPGAAAMDSGTQQQPTQRQWRVKANEVEVRSAADALQTIQLGLQRRRTAAIVRNAHSSRSHLFLRFRVELQRPHEPERATHAAMRAAMAAATAVAALPELGAMRGQMPSLSSQTANHVERSPVNKPEKPKGYKFLEAALRSTRNCASKSVSASPPRCVTELLFVDFAGSGRFELSGATGDAIKETQSIHSSLSAVVDVLAALAAAQPPRGPQPHGTGEGGAGSPLASCGASLAQRWGAMVGRFGVRLSCGPPVFLQPRAPTTAGGITRSYDADPQRDPEPGLALRRRALTRLDTRAAEHEAAERRVTSSHIPFRTCKTTQLLQSALGAPCKSLVLACVSPCGVAEVVLPAGAPERTGPTRDQVRRLFRRQAPAMISEVHATLALAGRLLPPEGAGARPRSA